MCRAPPPPPPPPVAKTVTLPAGTVIPIRMTDTLDSATTQPNTVFHGSLAGDLIVDGMVAARQGASVVGRVVTAKDATHFSGSSELSIELTRIDTVDQPVDCGDRRVYQAGQRPGKEHGGQDRRRRCAWGHHRRPAGGGKGAAIGAVTGGGVGAGVNGVTRGQQVQIPIGDAGQLPFAVAHQRDHLEDLGGSRGNNKGTRTNCNSDSRWPEPWWIPPFAKSAKDPDFPLRGPQPQARVRLSDKKQVLD